MDQFETLVITDRIFPHDPHFVTGSHGEVRGLMLVLMAGVTVEYSFDGTNVHGRLVPNTAAAGKSFDRRVFNKIWFRTTSSSTVDVETWGQTL